MAFIRIQHLKTDASGKILSGSASIAKCIYDKGGKYHSRQINVETLGEVIWLSEDRKSGIFKSMTRGIVFYDSKDDSFSPIGANDEKLKDTKVDIEPLVHSQFGDVYLALSCLNKYGLTGLIKDVFGKEAYERVIVHVLYSFLSNGSKMTPCNFMEKTFLPHLFKSVLVESLRYDEAYFMRMGNDSLKISFFRKFIDMMKKKEAGFGSSVYVDSTPIPTDSDNPMSRLCCHGTGSSCTQVRLALVLDQESGLPVWYDIIPGNVLDVNNLKDELRDVEESLGITIKSMILDAGYSSKELLSFLGDKKKAILRMPEKKGYPFQELFDDVEKEYNNPDCVFVRNEHNYVAIRKTIRLFDSCDIEAYSYIDKDNAESGAKQLEIKMSEDPSMKSVFDAKPTNEKKKELLGSGFFVLLSNYGYDAKKTLDEYFDRTHIETFFKDSKEGRRLLPLCKWKDESVRGKILSDMISTILYALFRKELSETKSVESSKKKGRKPKDLLPLNQLTVSEIISSCSTLMCMKKDGIIYIETPMKGVKQYYAFFGCSVTGSMTIDEIKKMLNL